MHECAGGKKLAGAIQSFLSIKDHMRRRQPAAVGAEITSNDDVAVHNLWQKVQIGRSLPPDNKSI